MQLMPLCSSRYTFSPKPAAGLAAALFMVTAAGVTALQGQNQSAASPDKSQYHLFHHTPRELLRELSTDRPDQTESPYTVDAGHFQVEMDLVNAVIDEDRSGGGEVQTTDFAVAGINLKVGLLNHVDLQFVFDTYVHSRIEDRIAGTAADASGSGEFQTRLKINFWGNDGGRTAFAMMPFVKWPLPESDLRNGETEGGVIFPFAMDLGGGWGLGAMTEFDFVSDNSGGHEVEYFNTITVGHDIVGDLGGYVEFAALVAPWSHEEWQGQVALGFTYGFSEDLQFDWGCNFGVTESAPDFNPFVGLSYRY